MHGHRLRGQSMAECPLNTYRPSLERLASNILQETFNMREALDHSLAVALCFDPAGLSFLSPTSLENNKFKRTPHRQDVYADNLPS